MASRIRSRLLFAPDSLTAERALLDVLAQEADRAPRGRKVVVVPSHSLRSALLVRLAGARPAWLGLEIVTLRALARALLERSGRSHRSGDPLLPVVVERLARRERPLARHLETLLDGFAGVEGAVRDLFDAGFVPELLDPALERIEVERGQLGNDALDRAAALFRIAANASLELESLGLSPGAGLFAAATEALAANPDRALPADAVFLHGFADATGVASDLLAEIVRKRPTVAVLVEPRALDGEGCGDWRFGKRLTERLRGFASAESLDLVAAAAHLSRAEAADPSREARAAVASLKAAILAGEPAEELAILFRDPAPYFSHLAREIDRQALPASGEAGPPSPQKRRARGLLELIERQGESTLGLAFSLAPEFLASASGALPWELRLAALAAGARHLAAFANLESAGDSVALPLHDRFAPVAETAAAPAGETEPGAEGGLRLGARARRLPAAALRRAQRQARALLDLLADLDRTQPLAAALGSVADLLTRLLSSDEERTELRSALRDLEAAAATAGPAWVVTPAEMILLLSAAWRAVGDSPLGGRGGGVALLSVTEARGRTFRRIVLGGLSRDRFPRAVKADPFLPDSLRLRLRDLLPDLPVKSEGHDEERFLFAQLLGAAPEVELLSPVTDDDGKPLTPSPFLDELRRAGRVGEAKPSRAAERSSQLDLAIRAALDGEGTSSTVLERTLRAAFLEGEARFEDRDSDRSTDRPHLEGASDTGSNSELRASAWAKSHLALLAEAVAAPDSPNAAALGPFFGFVGDRPRDEHALDLRHRIPPVTTLEGLADCGWRTFLGKLLRLAAPISGETEIPDLPGRLTGVVVHRVLERMAPPELRAVRTVAEAERQTEIEVPWPEAAALEAGIESAAVSALLEEGLDPELFTVPLAREAAEALAIVARCDWPRGRLPLLGLEVAGRARLPLAGGERSLTFRADRVQRNGEALLLSDYKTGAQVVSTAVKEETRLRHLEEAFAEGSWLQLPAYARNQGQGEVEGRLLFLKADLADEQRETRHAAPSRGSAAEAREFEVWQTLFDAWERGVFLPRLLDRDLEASPRRCEGCEVRVACLQGDSGARLRLQRWATDRRESSSPLVEPVAEDSSAEPLDTVAWRLFQLRVSPPSAPDEESV